MRRFALLTVSISVRLVHTAELPCCTDAGRGATRSPDDASEVPRVDSPTGALTAAAVHVRSPLQALQTLLNKKIAESPSLSTLPSLSRGVRLRLCVVADGSADLQAAPMEPAGDSYGVDPWVSVAGDAASTSYMEGAVQHTGAPALGGVASGFARAVAAALSGLPGNQPVASLRVSPPAPSPASPSSVSHSPMAVLDFTRTSSEDLGMAKRMLAARFPRLRLVVRHTSGTDIQSLRTHTFSVELRPMLEGAMVSEEERHALEAFVGASVGTGYHSTLRRALQEGFRALQIAFPPTSGGGTTPPATGAAEGGSNTVSILSTYQGVLRAHQVDLRVRVTSAAVYIRARDRQGDELYAISGDPKHTLSLILAAVEAVAEKVDPQATSFARRSITSAALVLVLPEKGVRVKHILRRLLNYHYGTPEEAVDFNVTLASPGVFSCVLRVPVPIEQDVSPPSSLVAGAGSVSPHAVCTLSVATATSKRAAMQLAAVQAMRDHFPRVFTEQVEFHPEVQELLEAAAPSAAGTCPHISRGLKVILDWATQQEVTPHRGAPHVDGADDSGEGCVPPTFTGASSTDGVQADGVRLSYLTRPLAAGQYSADGRYRAVANVWVTELSIMGTVLDGSRAYVLPLKVTATDAKKSRSEQKALAAAIAQRYRLLCPDAVRYAVQQGLIQANGEAMPCSGVVAVTAAEAEDGSARVAAQHTDRFLRALLTTPTQPLALPPLGRPSILQQLRAKAQASLGADGTFTAAGESVGPHQTRFALVERTTTARRSDDGGPAGRAAEVVTVQLCSVLAAEASVGSGGPRADSADAPYVVLAEASHTYQLCALLEAYRRLLVPVRPGAGADAPLGDTTDAPRRWLDALGVGENLPESLPAETPLETVCQTLQVLYGAAIDLHMYADRRRTTVELWASVEAGPGVPPVSAGSAPEKEKGGHDYYFLAKAHGTTSREAALRCAYSAFEIHVRAHQGVFPGRRLLRVSAVYTPTSESLLGKLTAAVAREIATTSGGGAACRGEVMVYIGQGGGAGARPTAKYAVVFSAVTETRRVELERVEASHLPGAMFDLCQCISSETGAPATLKAPQGPQYTYVQQLQNLLMDLCGAELRVETEQVEGEWHCRLSVPLSEAQAFYCLETACAAKKKDAMDAAASRALLQYFSERTPALRDGPASDAGSEREEETSPASEACAGPTRGNYVYSLL